MCASRSNFLIKCRFHSGKSHTLLLYNNGGQQIVILCVKSAERERHNAD
jgi:hypothetical protein